MSVQERIATFKRTIDRCHQRVSELEQYIKNLFQPVMAHRFRDICPEIRARVIHGIGQWIKAVPATYLNDTYLKYIVWALSDRVS